MQQLGWQDDEGQLRKVLKETFFKAASTATQPATAA